MIIFLPIVFIVL